MTPIETLYDQLRRAERQHPNPRARQAIGLERKILGLLMDAARDLESESKRLEWSEHRTASDLEASRQISLRAWERANAQGAEAQRVLRIFTT